MTPHKQSQEYGWFIIRLVGLVITIYAVYQLFALAYINYTFQENISKLKGMFPENQLAQNKKELIILPLILCLSQLAFGIYCLRGGGFFHQLLSYRGKTREIESPLANTPQEKRQQSREATVKRESNRSKELFRKFLLAHPEINKLDDRGKHLAFREWLGQ